MFQPNKSNIEGTDWFAEDEMDENENTEANFDLDFTLGSEMCKYSNNVWAVMKQRIYLWLVFFSSSCRRM